MNPTIKSPAISVFCICFDLLYNANINQFLPTAYIAEIENNKIAYIEKKATLETIKSCNIDVSSEMSLLLDVCNSLSVEFLTKKYNAKNKVKKTLVKLLEDVGFAKTILYFINFKLNYFLNLIAQNNLPIAINTERNKPFFEQQIRFSDSEIKAHLHFNKQEDKITYTLSLENQNGWFAPCDKNTKIVLNLPAWILVDKIMYKLAEINGNKLKPFLTKKTVEISEKNSKVYFETFIKDISNKVDIEAEGFVKTQRSEITKVTVKPIFFFLNDSYYFDLLFEYQDVVFLNSEKKKMKSQLIINNEISVIQTKRNYVAEQIWIEKLNNLGLKKQENDFFSFGEINYKYQNIQLLIEKKKLFEQNHFSIDNLEIENKKIALFFGTITMENQEKQDWFDVKMQITCGEFVFPFTKIISNIKTNNPFYQLPDDSFFLIPNEWFSSYKQLIDFGKPINDLFVLRKNQFTVLENLPIFSSETILNKQNISYEPSKNLLFTLRNYQIEGVKWLLNHYNNGFGACLADDMGLGKTLQTLAVLMYVKDNLKPTINTQPIDLFSEVTKANEPLRALIIVPTSLVFNWKNETKIFTPSLKSIVYVGNDRKKIKNKLHLYDIVFTSYAVALKDIEHLKTLSYRYLILDESQYIKNKNSKIFNAIHQLNSENKITLSGTPIENSLTDLWSQMQFINPELLGSFAFFTSIFKNPIEKNKDETAVLELKKLVNPYILRRTKEQVAKDLPPVSEQIFYSEMETEQKEMYEKEKSMVRNFLFNTFENQTVSKLNVLNALMKLRQIANHPKLIDENIGANSGKFLDVIEYLNTLLQAQKKVLIFSSFVKHLEIYTHWCQKNKFSYCLLTGKTSNEERENVVHQFQNNSEKLLFFISLKAGGVGLNLTEASYVLFLDPWWNPFSEHQAIARAHRIGQKKPVTVVRFIAKDTVEEKILLLQQKKKEISETIIDVEKIPDEIEHNLDYILK